MATTKKTQAVEEAPAVDIQALIAEQVAAQLKEKAGPEVPVIRCTSCWRKTGPGYRAPFYDTQGVCSECQRSGHGPNPDRAVCTRLGWATGSFVPGAAHELARAAGVPVENLLREDLYTQEDLGALWDKCSEGRWRPKNRAEKTQAENVQEEITAKHKVDSLKRRLETQRGQSVQILEAIAQTEKEIEREEANHKELLKRLGVE